MHKVAWTTQMLNTLYKKKRFVDKSGFEDNLVSKCILVLPADKEHMPECALKQFSCRSSGAGRRGKGQGPGPGGTAV